MNTNQNRFAVSLLVAGCFIIASTLMPSLGAAQLDKVKESMAALKTDTARLGAPKIEGTDTVAGKSVPGLYFGSTKINNDSTVVDTEAKEHGGVATLFVKAGDEYVRVATNLKNADGSRAIGTILDLSGPVIAAINKGEPYYGEARVLGKPYDAGYEPIRDVANNVIGVYFVGYASSVTARKEPARGRRSATRRSLEAYAATQRPRRLAAYQATSKRSAFITLFQAATKSFTNFSFESAHP